MKKQNTEIVLALIAVTLFAALMRLVPHIPNVAPIAGLALFAGVVIPSWGAFAIPLVAMVVSDMFLGFHGTVPFVYGSFFLIACIGYALRKKASPLTIILGSLSGSIIFFIITNFGVWTTSSMYEKTMSGLLQCYTMGLPFFRNTAVGDLAYTGAFFLGFRVFKLLFVLMLPSHQKGKRHVGNTV